MVGSDQLPSASRYHQRHLSREEKVHTKVLLSIGLLPCQACQVPSAEFSIGSRFNMQNSAIVCWLLCLKQRWLLCSETIMWLLCSETEVLSCSMNDERLQAPLPTCSCSWSSCNGMVWWHPCTAPREPHHNLPPIPKQLQQVRWLEKSVWTNSIYLLIYLCRHWTSTGNHAESQQFYSQKSERAHS